jgi:hypothetical protein
MARSRVGAGRLICATGVARTASRRERWRLEGRAMNVARWISLLAVAAALVVPRAAHAADTAPLIAPVAKLVAASNAGDRATFVALFTPDSTIVDDFAPYRFSAPGAAGKWYDGFGADATASGITGGVITMQTPKYINVTGTHAWVVVPLTYTYKTKGVAGKETGLLVFTERKTGGRWLFTTMSWGRLTVSTPP